ncbi:MAG: thiamine-phosphate kinase [Bacteroidetes bacterium]|nr:thiamine-phosphate kinase [Bacteroidota bacterium]
MEAKRTEIHELGEFGLISQLESSISLMNPSSIRGIGDDAAVIDIGNGFVQVVSTDMLVEGIHFDLTYIPLKYVGYKAVAVNVSDICAMNALAEQITVSVALSNRFSVEAVEELYDGIKMACSNYKVDIVGGDTTSSLSGLVISITVLGRAKKEDVVYRSGAKANDLIVVTGDLGAAYMGLQILEREKQIFQENPQIQPDLDAKDYILQRQMRPEARVDVIGFLKELNVQPTSMIDISDGLASELLHICKNSSVGCNIYDDKIPIDSQTSLTALEFEIDPSTCALNGGEDYELLFTISQNDFDKIKGNPHMTLIGHITNSDEGKYYIDKQGSAVELKAQGWVHFG